MWVGFAINHMKYIKIIISALIIFLCLIFFYYQQNQVTELAVYFLDVGQGDAILIRTPNNQDILIDGGPDKSVLTELDKILPFWDRDIELMILTHPHDDHLIGLNYVLENYQVEEVAYEDVDFYNPNFDFFQEYINNVQIKKMALAFNNKINLSENIFLEIYNYNKLEKFEDINDSSLIIKLIDEKNKYLFMGDASAILEEKLIITYMDLKADVLKVGHHGSKTASSIDFLNQVAPNYTIIPCGINNKFKHPHFKTLYNLGQQNINILRTDLIGTIKCISNNTIICSD